jgi:hypothetical protein
MDFKYNIFVGDIKKKILDNFNNNKLTDEEGEVS